MALIPPGSLVWRDCRSFQFPSNGPAIRLFGVAGKKLLLNAPRPLAEIIAHDAEHGLVRGRAQADGPVAAVDESIFAPGLPQCEQHRFVEFNVARCVPFS